MGEYRQHLRECSGWLTSDERQQLIRKLIAELQVQDAEPVAAPDPARVQRFWRFIAHRAGRAGELDVRRRRTTGCSMPRCAIAWKPRCESTT